MVTCSCTHRASGLHRFETVVSGERRYCIDCGERDVDWSSGVTEPGSVRALTYEEAMADSRRALWTPIKWPGFPKDRVVLITRQLRNNGQWTIDRYHPGDPLPPLVADVERATHWAEDTLGTP